MANEAGIAGTAVAAAVVYELGAEVVNSTIGRDALPALRSVIRKRTVSKAFKFVTPGWLRWGALLGIGYIGGQLLARRARAR
jgi:hypothetical protein